MRRLLCLSVCLCLLFCSSCTEGSAAPVTTGFRCRIHTEYDGIAIEAVLDCRDDSHAIVEFQSPKELEGVRLISENGSLNLEFLGMSFDIPKEYQTETMVLSVMLDALQNLAVQQDKEDSRFVFDTISGMPLSFTDGVTVFFSDWETEPVDHIT